jgi:diguanylate cyclase (GGDEF)-like protein
LPDIPLPWLSAALVLAAGSAATFSHTLVKQHSRDPVVALGWSAAGAVSAGSGLWAAVLVLWLGLGWSGQYRVEAVHTGWLLAVGGMAAALVAGWLLPRRLRGLGVGVGLTAALLLLLRGLLDAPVLPAPLLELRWVGLASLLALLLCGAAVQVATAASADAAEPTLRRGLLAALLLALGLVALGSGGAMALQAPGAEHPSAFVGTELLLDPSQLLRVVLLGAVALGVGLVGALVDLRTRRGTRDLAASLQRANQQLSQMALRDALTGLANRTLFDERLRLALENVGRSPSSLAVLYLDVDGFKPINDSFGHAAGDAVLREVGQRLLALAGEGETAARVGGDEFLLLLEQADEPGAAGALARRALQVLGQPYRLPGGTEVSLSCSIGIALFPQHGPVAKLVPNADAAMYAAKGVGGSTFAFFEPGMDLDARNEVELHRDLRGALERRELQLYYQPKVEARTGEVTGAEALVRWEHPTRGTVTPYLLIPVAERFGLIGALGAWVIDEACRQAREWMDAGMRIRVAVNLSVHQLRQEDLVSRVHRALHAHQLEPQLLSFEITESVAMEDTQATMHTFSQLAQLGVMLAIDDFGTGHSSLAYLRKLPARQLKIDRSFVADLETSADALAVVDAVVSLAHALGLRVVAEGVETEGQRELLLGLRCDELQGFLIARPMAARSLAFWVMEDTGPDSGHAEFQGRLFTDSRAQPLWS